MRVVPVGSASHRVSRAAGSIRVAGLGASILAAIALLSLGLWIRGQLAEKRASAVVRKAIAAQRFDDANTHIAAWLARNPDSPEAHFLSARTAFGLGRFAEVKTELDRAEALGYSEREIRRLRAFLLVATGRYADAEPTLVRLVADARGPDPEADEALARVFLQTYKLEAAAKVLDRWIRDAPNDPRPYFWYTEVDRRTATPADVIVDHYRKALERDPNHDAARLGLADALRTAHRNAEAAPEYERYLARKPNDAAGYAGAGAVAAELGQTDLAIRYLDRALALDPKNLMALKERAALEIRNNRHERALDLLRRATEQDPYDTETLYRYGIALARSGRSKEASAVQAQVARIRKEQEELDQIRIRLNANPNNNDLRAEIARWMLDHGHEEAGLQWTRTILTSMATHKPTLRLLADYYKRRGNAGLAQFYRLQLDAAGGASDDTTKRAQDFPKNTR
jgi:tetratricopeptide (TPR) repeat protein